VNDLERRPHRIEDRVETLEAPARGVAVHEEDPGDTADTSAGAVA
jgi:hypothetical protein